MRTIPAAMWSLWQQGGPFIGDNRPNARVTVEKDWQLHLDSEVETARPSKLPFRWFQRQDNSQVETEVPNIKSIEIDRSLDADAATATITIYNQQMDPNLTGQGRRLGHPGVLTWRTPTRAAQARWDQVKGPWADVLIPNALLRTYQGYGGWDKDTRTAIQDGNLILTGVWLIDDVNPTTDGMLQIKCRDMAKLLIEQQIYPPLVPTSLYPPYYERFHPTYWESQAVLDPVTGKTAYDSTDPVEQGPPAEGPKYVTDIALGTDNQGYWVVGTDGGVFAYVEPFYGSRGDNTPADDAPMVGIAADPLGRGYWLAAKSGGVFTFGECGFYGSPHDVPGHAPIAKIAAHPSGRGYWLVAEDGGVFAYGAAQYHGGSPATGGYKVVDICPTSTGNGYWLLSENGGVFTYGDAPFHGSFVDNSVNKTVGMAATPGDAGYWVARKNGDVSPFGDAPSLGPNGPWDTNNATRTLNDPIFNIKSTASGYGYVLVAGDGGVFSFGSAPFAGSLPGSFGTITYTDGNYKDYCVDAETEIFTRRGWLTHDQLVVGDETLAINPDTGKSEWNEITNIYRSEKIDFPMRHYETQRHSSLTTRDHKWWVKHDRFGWQWRTSDCIDIQTAIPMAAECTQLPEATYDDDFVRLVGWFWTEGCFSGGRASLSQSLSHNPENVTDIDCILKRLYGEGGRLRDGHRYHVYDRKSGDGSQLRVYRLAAEVRDSLLGVMDAEKVMTFEFLNALNQEQLDILIDVSLRADGHVRTNSMTLGQVSERRRDAFAYACSLAGRAYACSQFVTSSGTTQYNISIYRNRGLFTWPEVSARNAKTVPTPNREVLYTGTIWCPTTPHHNWLARRNGTVYFTGNSDIVKDFLLWSGWLLYGTGQDDVYGNLEDTGAYLNDSFNIYEFDKKSVIDAITTIKQIVGFMFWVDDEGAARFESPNWFNVGNFMEDGTHVDIVPEIDERHNLTNYSVTFSDKDMRSEIIIAVYDPALTTTNGMDPSANLVTKVTVATPGIDILRGMVRPALWTNDLFTREPEMVEMAEMVALHIQRGLRVGSATIAANPAIQVNDQVRIQEEITGETYIHYVRGVRSQQDLDTGSYTMDLNTNWLISDQ